MYACILAGVDGSTHAEHALQHAVALAKACGAELRIVHVADMGWLPVGPELGIDIDRLLDARRANGKKLLADAVELARKAGFAAEARLVETATPAQPADGVARRSTIPLVLVP